MRLPGQLRFDQQVSYYDDHYDDQCAGHYDDDDYCGAYLLAHRLQWIYYLRLVWINRYVLLREDRRG